MRIQEAATESETALGDPRAHLISLFEDHFDGVHQFCLARTGNTAAADDVAAEAFLAAARVCSGGGGASIDRPWLFVVARRRLIDHWRQKERHRKRVAKVLLLGGTQKEGADEDSDAVGERVLAALDCLPERQRAALTLRYLDDFSVGEVADALSVEYQAAESLLARGRRGFRKAWESA